MLSLNHGFNYVRDSLFLKLETQWMSTNGKKQIDNGVK